MNVLPNGLDVLMNNIPQRIINEGDPFAVAGRIQPTPAMVGLRSWSNGGSPMPQTRSLENTFRYGSDRIATTDVVYPDGTVESLWFREFESIQHGVSLLNYVGVRETDIEDRFGRGSYEQKRDALSVIGGNLDDGDRTNPYILTPDGTKHFVTLDERDGQVRGIDTTSVAVDGSKEKEIISFGDAGEVQLVTSHLVNPDGKTVGNSRQSYEYDEIEGVGLAPIRISSQREPKKTIPAHLDDQTFTFEYAKKDDGSMTVTTERIIGGNIVRGREARTYTPSGLLVRSSDYVRNAAGLARNVHEIVVAPAYWAEGQLSVAGLYKQVTQRAAA